MTKLHVQGKSFNYIGNDEWPGSSSDLKAYEILGTIMEEGVKLYGDHMGRS